ncbi:LpqB family beta-propeller domain-containing protein [Microbacterium lacticum]
MTTKAATAVDDRRGLVPPTIDPSGWVWTVPASTPAGLRATPPSGDAVTMGEAWTGVDSIQAMQISRDGTRIAAAFTIGNKSWLMAAGVLRDGKGVPTGLGQPQRVAALSGPGVSAAWLDDSTVGVVVTSRDERVLLRQTIGGTATRSTIASDITTIAGVNSPTVARLLGVDGTLYTRRGITPQVSANGVLMLGTQQGPG